MTTPTHPRDPRRGLSIFCWNIANPSLDRAKKQMAWLNGCEAELLVLTESKASEGCAFLERSFLERGYQVAVGRPDGGEYGVMIASKLATTPTSIGARMPFLSSRTVSVTISGFEPKLEVVGVYIPSRDASVEKREKKKRFLDALAIALEEPSAGRVFCGDFNVLEPDHVPFYSVFEPWEYGFFRRLEDLGFTDAFRALHPKAAEYSWVGRTGDGYRYDHAFITSDLLTGLKACRYDHEPRQRRLSDHSAIVLTLAVSERRGRANLLPVKPFVEDAEPSQTALF